MALVWKYVDIIGQSNFNNVTMNSLFIPVITPPIINQCKTQWKRGRNQGRQTSGGNTTSMNGQTGNSASPKGQWRTANTR